ncbi:MAG: DUF4105 domain-containing protein [bacterium]|nr:DUF4105 domain-containing protein [bacterium]
MMRRAIRLLKFLFALALLAALAYGALILLVRPSLERDWTSDQAVLARAEISGNIIAIKNIRNINYRSTSDYDVHYYDKTFDLDKMQSVWFMVEPFSGHGAGAAHTLVSFGFEGGDYVAISVEIRKEKGESFSPVKGLLRQYELVYVVADERDVIKLRSNYRKDDVFLYPVKTTKEKMQKLFVSMLERANKLATEPEFYNTLTSTCTTNIVTHVNEIVPGRIPFSYKVLMPAYSDELARKIGLIDNTLSIEELRAKYKINERALEFADDPLFSERIRE